MATRWLVFKNGETLGPWSSLRVREELRAGRLEPSDLVAGEDDKIRRPLIEVDAIFESAAVQPAAVESAGPSQTQLIQDDSMPISAGEQPRQRTFEALASPARVYATSRPKRVGHPKQSSHGRSGYIIWVPGGRPQGPFTGQEILTLWSARKLGPGTKIQKSDGQRRIDVETFVKFYGRQAGVASLKQGSLMADRKFYGLALLGVAVVLLLAAVVLYHVLTPEVIMPPETDEPRDNTSAANVGVPHATEDFSRERFVPSTPSNVLTPERGEPPRKGSPAFGVVLPKPAARKAQQTPVAKPVAKPAAKPVPRTVPPTSTRASVFKPGEVVSITGYQFNINALQACDLKCKLVMTGPQGPVTAVFFKEAFGALLQGRANGVSLTGMVRRDPATGAVLLIVQRVQ